jgi:hypothetical protein
MIPRPELPNDPSSASALTQALTSIALTEAKSTFPLDVTI